MPMAGSMAVPSMGITNAPFQRFPKVLQYALAIGVHPVQEGLGLNIALISDLTRPLRRFPEVLWHTLASVVHPAQIQ